MKAQKSVVLSILAGCLLLGTNTAYGAKTSKPITAHKPASPAIAAPEAPELTAADQKVTKAKEQLETAKKQLEAARALVRAAEADFKAARAAREALALQLKADGLADASGLKQLAVAGATNTNKTTPAQGLAPAQTTQQSDFSAEQSNSDTPQLRQ
jgi:hypothetical protein